MLVLKTNNIFTWDVPFGYTHSNTNLFSWKQ